MHLHNSKQTPRELSVNIFRSKQRWATQVQRMTDTDLQQEHTTQKRMQKMNADIRDGVTARNGTCEGRLTSHKWKMTVEDGGRWLTNEAEEGTE